MGALNFVYDKSNQPTQLTGSSSGTYTYDGKFKRVKVDADGKVIYNVFDASGALVHVDKVSGGTTNIPVCFTDCSTVAVSGPQTIDYIKSGSLSIRLENDEPTYLHNDLLGSPVAGTDKFGNVIWQEQYTPYGEKILNSAANDDLGSFTGHIDDSSTGLTYMQARYYDPVIGRFLSNDPVSFLGHLNGKQGVQGFSRYAYVNNNPYKYTDPDGEIANFALGFALGAGIELASQVFSGQDIKVGKIALAGAAGMAGGGITAAASLVTKTAGLGKVGGAVMKGLGEVNASVAGDIIQGKETTVGGTLANIAGGKAVGAMGKVTGNVGGKTLSKVSNSRPTKGTPNSRKSRRQAQRADKRAGQAGANVGDVIGSGAGGKAAEVICSNLEGGC